VVGEFEEKRLLRAQTKVERGNSKMVTREIDLKIWIEFVWFRIRIGVGLLQI
jgi:hypothetical protein